MTVHPAALIYPGCRIEAGATIGPFAVIGFTEERPGGPETYIGKGVTIGPHAVIGAGCRVADFTNVSAGVSIGRNTKIGSNVELFHRAQIHDDAQIDDEAWIGGFICNRAIIGRRAVVYGRLIHRFVDAAVGIPEPSPIVEEEAFVGEHALLIGGVRIGRQAYVAAGAVVTADVPPFRLVVGIPARDRSRAPAPFLRRPAPRT